MRNLQPHQFAEVEFVQLFRGKCEGPWKTPKSQRAFRKKMMVAVPEKFFIHRTLQARLLRKDPAEAIPP